MVGIDQRRRGLLVEIKKLADISSRGGKVPPVYLYLVFILPGFVFSIDKIGRPEYVPFVLVSFAIVPLIIATNLFDDYFDYARGFDTPESPNTRYRHHPIFYYNVTPGYLIKWALVFSAMYLLISFLISLWYGMALDLIAVVGLLLGYGYTGPPFGYKYRGLGEIGVFLSTIAASEFIAVATAGRFYSTSILYFVPFSLLIALLLFIGNYRDVEFDLRAGFKTLAIILGKRKSELFSVAIFTLFYATVILLCSLKIYSTPSLIDLASAPFAYYLSFRWFRRESARFERFAGPFLFGILVLLLVMLVV